MKVKFSGSFRRYLVQWEGPRVETEALRAELPERLFEERFRSIENAASEVKAVGWSALDGLVPGDFSELDMWFGRVWIMGLRIDEKRIPGGALKVRVLEAERAERREVGGEIPQARRREIREAIEVDLMARSIPSTRIHQVLWNTATDQLLFSATSDAPNGALLALFRETVDASLAPMVPSTVAERFDWGDGDRSRLDSLAPALYVG